MTIPKFKFQGLFNRAATYVKLYVHNKEYDTSLEDLFASAPPEDINELLPYKSYCAQLNQQGDPQTLTSGPLVIGKEYVITTYNTSKSFTSGVLNIGYSYVINVVEVGDDFANVGYVSDGVPFFALADTPTVWANGTQVETFIPDDFTNVGAESNADGVIFVATGTTPTSWESESILDFEGTPTATVFENTIGDLSLEYDSTGLYNIVSADPIFTADKTFVQFTSSITDEAPITLAERTDNNTVQLATQDDTFTLKNTWTGYLQIKLYK
jgi:hypothetical protein